MESRGSLPLPVRWRSHRTRAPQVLNFHRSLFTGFAQSAEQFLTVEVLARTIALYDAQFLALDFLVSCESEGATQALSAASDGAPLPCFS